LQDRGRTLKMSFEIWLLFIEHIIAIGEAIIVIVIAPFIF